MIDRQWRGHAIKDIPAEHFKRGFDPEGRHPGLVLALTDFVPEGINDEWFLSEQQCSGFTNISRRAAVRMLSLRREIEISARDISDATFIEPALGKPCAMSEAQKHEIQQRYLTHLKGMALTCRPERLVNLAQTLSPLDATPENLHRLSPCIVDLNAYTEAADLILFLVCSHIDGAATLDPVWPK